jgi:D-hydroxyproline dehydrogenase
MKPASTPPATVVVVGGGIIGLACALHLRVRGIDTLLIDEARESPPASWGNAGHIAVEQVEPLASMRTLAAVPRRLFSRGGALALPPRDIAAWLPFALRLGRASLPARFRLGKAALAALLARALPAWRRLTLLAEAREQLAEDGHYVVWESASGARSGRAYWSAADIGTARVRDLTRDEAAHIAELVARAPVDGLRFDGTARVRDPGALVARLKAAFVSAGGVHRQARVEQVTVENSRAMLALDDGGTRGSVATIVIAAGIGSGRLLRPLGHRVPMIAERGYHIQADAPPWPDMPPVVFEERSMIVSRFQSGLRATSFVEFAHEASPADPRKWQRLRAHAAELGLPFSTAPREWIGARPTLPDYLPAIGRSRIAHNLLYAFGHQHLGLTLAAITGELVTQLACDEPAELDLAPYALERF